MRLVLIFAGVVVAFLPEHCLALLVEYQLSIFVIGVVLLGVPHGAADVLVASTSASHAQRSFSLYHFLLGYLGRIALFGALFWAWPILGFVIFLLFSAYHFGETDLVQFKTSPTVGKWLVTSYGLVVLSVLLLSHWGEVEALLQSYLPASVAGWISANRWLLLCSIGAMLVLSALVYARSTRHLRPFTNYRTYVYSLLSLLVMIKLPLLLGFTFYFVIWHSLLSLKNIFRYLEQENRWSKQFIFKQILLYSTLALLGIGLLGSLGLMFQNQSTFVLSLFLGLAVLTAPHMQVMHDMYGTVNSEQ